MLYGLRLSASDTQAVASDELVVTVSPEVPPPNHAPVVSAGPDRALRQPETTLALAGTVADDGRPGGALSHTWSVVSGPGPVAFGDAASITTSATFEAPGTYVLRLSASDGALGKFDDTTVFYALRDRAPRPRGEKRRRLDDRRRSAVAVPQRLGRCRARQPRRGPAAGPFLLTLFEDRNQDGVYDAGTDAVLGEQALTGLDGSATLVVAVPVAGQATFAGNLVYAFVDRTLAVAELDETNNYGSSSPACAPPRSAGDWDVGLEWAWTKPSVDPTSNRVTSPPVVIDLDGDGAPELVFVSAYFGPLAYASQARLRAVSGRDGREIWSVTDPALALSGNTAPAAADIDGDGRPEIVVGAENNATLLAFEHDGSLKWRSDVLSQALDWGGPSIADLDADGVPEIVIGRQVLTNQGHLRWTGAGPSRGGDRGANSIVVDLDLDGRPEVVAGNTAYVGQGSSQGQILWRNTTSIGGAGDPGRLRRRGELRQRPESRDRPRLARMGAAARARRKREVGTDLHRPLDLGPVGRPADGGRSRRRRRPRNRGPRAPLLQRVRRRRLAQVAGADRRLHHRDRLGGVRLRRRRRRGDRLRRPRRH